MSISKMVARMLTLRGPPICYSGIEADDVLSRNACCLCGVIYSKTSGDGRAGYVSKTNYHISILGLHVCAAACRSLYLPTDALLLSCIHCLNKP